MKKRIAAEFVGTFVIVLAPVALSGAANLQGISPSLVVAALVSGLSVLAMVYALGPISAAHFNPAVTLGFAIAGRFPWRYVALYWMAQFAGSIAAVGVSRLIFSMSSGVHLPADPLAIGRNIGVEIVISFFLMLVIMAVATDRRVPGSTPAIAIGSTVILGVLIGGPVTGGSMNPARSLGPALFDPAALSQVWLYIVAPCLGAALAAIVYENLRLDSTYAQDAPDGLPRN